MWRAVLGSLAIAAASVAVVAPAPDYDPWAWLVWGRELAGGDLSTVDGPAFKPLPVAVCAALSAFGGAAPWLWVVLARAGAVLAVWLAYRVAGRGWAGLLAGVAVVLCAGFLDGAARGLGEALLLALALAGLEAWRGGRIGWALACAAACALIRVEAWPFAAAAAVLAWRRYPATRPALAAAAVAIPAAWLLPELAGSGDLLRSGARARVPNPGQPALADVPALAALWAAVTVPPWPVWIGVAALAGRRRAAGRDGAVAGRDEGASLALAGAGLAWIALVAVMAQVGFSGEARYALPGAALVAIAGATGLVALVRRLARNDARLARPWGVAVAGVLVLAAAAPRVAGLDDVRSRQAHAWALQRDLAVAVQAAGGREAVLACGRPYVGPLRGPLMAYRLGVQRRVIEPDARPRPPGVVFRSALTRAADPQPDAPPAFSPVARAGGWSVLRTCRS